MDFGWCPILQYKKSKAEKKKEQKGEAPTISLVVGLPVPDSSKLDSSDGLANLKPVAVNLAQDILVSSS